MNNKPQLKLNRNLIKRVELLPNVSEFYTQKLGIHEYAAVYGIEKVIRTTKVVRLTKGEPNRYLQRIALRLTHLAHENRIDDYEKLSNIVLKKSISFRLLALNRTIHDWYTLPIRKLDRIWRTLSSLCANNSFKLDTKRVWIDKKPNDYARPLTVPTPAWRCYSFMRMDHLERFMKARELLKPWQHGGRSGVGVLSCYKALIPMMLSSNTIYEFDIKGFFDNIRHDTIVKTIQGYFGESTAEWIKNILSTQPNKYILPPKEDDIATKLYEKVVDTLTVEHHGPVEKLKWFGHDLFKGQFYSLVLRQDGRGAYISNGTADALLNYPEDIVEANFWKGWESLPTYTLDKVYKDLMNLGSITKTSGFNMVRPQEPVTELARAQGRDNWKGLGKPGFGVPQGLGTSPLLSTFMTDVYLDELGARGNLIMYMDDGILFARNKAEMEKIKERLIELLDKIGLEIAPEKSGYIKIDNKWIKDTKFLGLKFLPGENNIMSDTRSGTQMKFPLNEKWDDVKLLALSHGSSISNIKIKFDRLINTQAYEAGLKHGFLGCLIANSQYRDNLSNTEKREAIMRGQSSSWAKIQASQGFVWKFQDLHSHNEYLTNVSSIQVLKFLDLLRKGKKLYVSELKPRAMKQRYMG